MNTLETIFKAYTEENTKLEKGDFSVFKKSKFLTSYTVFSISYVKFMIVDMLLFKNKRFNYLFGKNG